MPRLSGLVFPAVAARPAAQPQRYGAAAEARTD